MRKILTVSVLGTALMLPYQASAATGADLAEWCADYPDGKGSSLCTGYVQSVLTLMRRGSASWSYEVTACVPEDADMARVIAIINRRMAADSGLKDIRLGYAVATALQPEFPCAE